MGDPGRLRQVLVNLVGNALKFTPAGEVIVSIERLASVSGMAALRFIVRDTGIGIPPEKQSKIFKPFEQADASTTRKYGGTGLGLSISAKLVELMGGKLSVESEPGAGSAFAFTLPCELDSAGSAGAPQPGIAGRALVVATHAATRRIVESLLASFGLHVTAVAAAPAALGELRGAAGSPDAYRLVVVDASATGLEPVELLCATRTLDPTIAVVALAKTTSRSDLARRPATADIVQVRKPVREAELLRAVRDALGGGVAVPPPPALNETAAETSSLKLSILVAEDNVVNQKLVARMLESMGHRVTLSDNGHDAVEKRFDGCRFDIVLMDMQMPRMDGLEAARAIRARELQTVEARIPIVALTANALPSDRTACLAAGMDDYLSKPVRKHELANVLRKWQPALAAADVPAEPPAVRRAFHYEDALANVGGDRELLKEIAALVLEDAPVQLATLRDARDRGDLGAIRGVAHGLKGAVGGIGGTELSDVLQELENAARDGLAEPVQALCSAAFTGWNQLGAELRGWLA
jgi:CheY-like chemotaxis protein/HPt (histidine-containing phosphotransfer) domain-containing protein